MLMPHFFSPCRTLAQSLCALLLLSSAAAAATVAPLEGAPLTVTAVTLTAEQVLGDGKPLLALRDTDWIELSAANNTGTVADTAPLGALALGLWLTDGSWLPVLSIAAGADDALAVTTPFGLHEIPLTSISGWGINETAPAEAGLDRVLVASGTVDGRVQGLRDGKLLIATSLDPEPLALAFNDIQGVRLAQGSTRATGLGLLVTIEANRPPLRLVATATGLQLAASHQPIDSSLLKGHRLRVDGGRRTWISDLAPATVVEKGAFDVVWPWQRDHALDGGPLLLSGIRYAKGITVHSAATVTWNLDRRFVRLRGLLGIADAVAPEGDCPVTLSGDGKTLWHSDRVRGGEAPASLDLDLQGVTSLRLEIALGERFDIGDHVMLADAYLVQAAK
jgi:hypothetical protein